MLLYLAPVVRLLTLSAAAALLDQAHSKAASRRRRGITSNGGPACFMLAPDIDRHGPALRFRSAGSKLHALEFIADERIVVPQITFSALVTVHSIAASGFSIPRPGDSRTASVDGRARPVSGIDRRVRCGTSPLAVAGDERLLRGDIGG